MEQGDPGMGAILGAGPTVRLPGARDPGGGRLRRGCLSEPVGSAKVADCWGPWYRRCSRGPRHPGACRHPDRTRETLGWLGFRIPSATALRVLKVLLRPADSPRACELAPGR